MAILGPFVHGVPQRIEIGIESDGRIASISLNAIFPAGAGTHERCEITERCTWLEPERKMLRLHFRCILRKFVEPPP